MRWICTVFLLPYKATDRHGHVDHDDDDDHYDDDDADDDDDDDDDAE